MKRISIICCFALLGLSSQLFAQTADSNQTNSICTGNGPECGNHCCCAGNSQAPLGVMTDHIHKKGQWMLTYTFMSTAMDGNHQGTERLTDADMYKQYSMAPETMTMQMHMLMAMYGVTNKLTLMAMTSYMTNSMNMNMYMPGMVMPGMNMPGGIMGMQSVSGGLTDTRISALYNFSNTTARRIIGSLGISLPTGTIMATGTTMLGDNQRLAYDMQTGTGSFSLQPDITYARNRGNFYWGANIGGDVKLNYNNLGYRQGNVYHGTAWAGYQVLPFLGFTLRAEDVNTGKISGSDAMMDNSAYKVGDPTTVTANYGGQCINAYAGLNFYLMKPVLEHFRLMAEYGRPVYQNLIGTQMALSANSYAGVQYVF